MKFVKFFVMTVIVSVGGLVLFSGKAEAAMLPPTSLPEDSSIYFTVSAGNTAPTSDNRLYSPEVYIRIYSTNDSGGTVTFPHGNHCDGADASGMNGYDYYVAGDTTRFEFFETNGSGEALSGVDSTASSVYQSGVSSACGSVNLTIPAGRLTQSSDVSHVTSTGARLYIGLIRVRMDPSTSTISGPLNSFRVTGGGYYYGNVGQSGKTQTFIGRPRSATADDYELRFKPNCSEFNSVNSKVITLKWFDDDAHTTYQVGDVKMRIEESDEHESTPWTTIATKTLATNGEGRAGTWDITVKKDKKYRWIWDDITRNNGVQVEYPYESGDFYFPCDPPPRGDFTSGDSSSCSNITGWAIDDSNPSGTVNIELFIDGVSQGTYPANINSPSDVPDRGAHRFSIPFPDAEKDAFSHDVKLVAKNIGPQSNNDEDLGTKQINPCRLPRCVNPTTNPTVPQYNTSFSVNASFIYNVDNSKGRAINYTMIVAVDGATPTPIKSVSGYWSEKGRIVPTSLVVDGSWRKDAHTISDFTIATEGTYNVEYNLHYIIPVSSVTEATNQGYSNPYLSSNGNYYAVVNCYNNNEQNIEIGRWPYYKIYGNDAMAGGAFANGTVCSGGVANPNATFRGLNYSGTLVPGGAYGYVRGAGAQFALFALGSIQEVPSSSARPFATNNSNLGGAAMYPTRQTFANFSEGTIYDNYGGGGGITRTCIPDYWSMRTGALASTAAPASNWITPGFVAARRVVTPAAGHGPLIIRNQNFQFPTIPAGYSPSDLIKDQTIYVNGDARIENGDTNDDAPDGSETDGIVYGAFNSAATAPNFTLIVRGDIYIDNNTDQLDGTYIAQPYDSDGNGSLDKGGRIITCYRSGANTPVPLDDIDTECASKLTVNGALIAKQIKLLRTNGSWIEGMANPPVNFNFSWTGSGNSTTQPSSRCVNVNEPDDAAGEGDWHDNYLCVPNSGIFSRYDFQWISNGAATPAGKTCVNFYEPADAAHGWGAGSNKLCYRDNNEGHDLKFYSGESGAPFPGTGTEPFLVTPTHKYNWYHDTRVFNQWRQPDAATIHVWSGQADGLDRRCIRIVESSDMNRVNRSPATPGANPAFPADFWAPAGISGRHNGTWGDNWLCERVFTANPAAAEDHLGNNNIAEVFNFSPEVYLQPSNFTETTTRNKYDNITTLPPIF